MKFDFWFVAALLALRLVSGSDALAADVRSQEGGNQPAADGQARDRIDAFILKEMEKAGVKGLSVAIIDGGKIVKEKGYGFADAENRIPVTPTTLFQAASISKSVTAMGALCLVEKKTLSLDEDVNAKLTSWRVPENQYTKDEKVTLARLLSHMGGTSVGGFAGYARGADPAVGRYP